MDGLVDVSIREARAYQHLYQYNRGYLLCDLGSSRQRHSGSHIQFWDGMNEHGSLFKLLLAHPATQTDTPLRFVLSLHPSHPSSFSPL